MNIKGSLKKLWIATIIIILITNIAIIGYYAIRIMSVIGGVQKKDEEATMIVLSELFVNELSMDNVDIFLETVENAGYDGELFSQLFLNYEMLIVLAIILLSILILVALLIHTLVQLEKNNPEKRIAQLELEVKELEKRLAKEVDYVNKINNQMQNFTENIAHQIKTPLSAIMLDLELMNERIEKSPKQIENCYYHINRIQEFIRRLLNISRLENNKVIMKKEDIYLKSLLDDVIEAAGLEKNRITIDDLDDKYKIIGDEEWLKEAFINILSNSMEFIKGNADGGVFVKLKCMSDRCTIAIHDNGKGFEEDGEMNIFNRFETSRDSNTFHAGIGLNLAKMVIESHYGTISASNSNEYGGACFTVNIPIYVLKEKKA